MKKSLQYWIIGIGLFAAGISHSQIPTNRIRPGTMYYPGDTVRSPRMGVLAKVPEGWEGVLPRETEVFLLMSNTINGEIYVVLNEHLDSQGQRKRWIEGMDFGQGLRLLPDGEITTRGDILCAKGKMTGSGANTAYKVYAEAKCSPFGFCLTYLTLTSDATAYEKVKKGMQTFVDNTWFVKPSTESPFAKFNWTKFLSGKVFLNIDYEQTSKREDEVSLCGDGTFSSQITRKGLFKNESKEYKGNKKGKWEVKGEGEKATLTLAIPKLAPVVVNLEIRNEEVYVNGTRYFVGASEKCK